MFLAVFGYLEELSRVSPAFSMEKHRACHLPCGSSHAESCETASLNGLKRKTLKP